LQIFNHIKRKGAQMIDSKLIGRRLREGREAKGMTGAELSEKLGICQAQISRLENGEQGLRFDRARDFCKVLGLEPHELMLPEDWNADVPFIPPELLTRMRKNPHFVQLCNLLNGLNVSNYNAANAMIVQLAKGNK